MQKYLINEAHIYSGKTECLNIQIKKKLNKYLLVLAIKQQELFIFRVKKGNS